MFFNSFKRDLEYFANKLSNFYRNNGFQNEIAIINKFGLQNIYNQIIGDRNLNIKEIDERIERLKKEKEIFWSEEGIDEKIEKYGKLKFLVEARSALDNLDYFINKIDNENKIIIEMNKKKLESLKKTFVRSYYREVKFYSKNFDFSKFTEIYKDNFQNCKEIIQKEFENLNAILNKDFLEIEEIYEKYLKAQLKICERLYFLNIVEFLYHKALENTYQIIKKFNDICDKILESAIELSKEYLDVETLSYIINEDKINQWLTNFFNKKKTLIEKEKEENKK